MRLFLTHSVCPRNLLDIKKNGRYTLDILSESEVRANFLQNTFATKYFKPVEILGFVWSVSGSNNALYVFRNPIQSHVGREMGN